MFTRNIYLADFVGYQPNYYHNSQLLEFLFNYYEFFQELQKYKLLFNPFASEAVYTRNFFFDCLSDSV